MKLLNFKNKYEVNYINEYFCSFVLYFIIGWLNLYKEAGLIQINSLALGCGISYLVSNTMSKNYNSGYFNVSITVSKYLTNEITLINLLLLFVAQILASLSSGLLIYHLTPYSFDQSTESLVGIGIFNDLRTSYYSCFMLEFIFSLFIAIGYCNLKTNSYKLNIYLLLLYTLSYLICYDINRCNLNNSKLLGFSIIIIRNYTNFFIYFIPNLLGSIISYLYTTNMC